MYFDKQNTFGWQQIVTGTGNVLGTDFIDSYGGLTTVPGVPPQSINGPIGAPIGRDYGRGEPMEVVAQVVGAGFAGGTSIQFQIGDASASDGTGFAVLDETPAIALATHNVLGYRWRVRFVPTGMTQRWLGVRYVLVGTYTGNLGLVTAGLVRNRESSYVP